MGRLGGLVFLAVWLLGGLWGCAPAAADSNGLQTRVAMLEAEISQLTDKVHALDGSARLAAEEVMALRGRAGELARRMAVAEYERHGGRAKGLLSYEAALQGCLREIEQRADQTYLVEDVVFLSDFALLQPSSPVGPAWQFTIHGSSGRFIVTLDAQSSKLVFKNRIG